MTWTLYHGSCLDPVTGLARLGDKSVDVGIMDPPYEAEAHFKGKRQSPTADGRKRVVDAEFSFLPITEYERDAVAQELSRVVIQRVLVFCQVEAIHLWRGSLERAGMKYRRTIPWVKPDAMPSLHGRWPGQSFEAIVLVTQPGSLPCPIGGKARYYERTRAQSSGHPTTKPLALLGEIVEDFTLRGNLVVDPYAGSGTTGVACSQLGRNFVGWEINAEYHAIAERRLRGECALLNPAQPELF